MTIQVISQTRDSVQIIEKLSLLRMPKSLTPTELVVNYFKQNEVSGEWDVNNKLTQEVVLGADVS